MILSELYNYIEENFYKPIRDFVNSLTFIEKLDLLIRLDYLDFSLYSIGFFGNFKLSY